MKNQKSQLIAQKLQEEYSQKNESNLDKLKALDRKAKLPAKIFAGVFGTASSLIFGTGLCLAMQVIGQTTSLMIVGIVVGIVGMAMVSATYPIYQKMLASRKKKFSSRILQITDQILKED